MKKIVSIQDISCFGKCSLTVALPIISSMGVETAIIPTAVLSTHTQFSGYTFTDLTDDIERISDHWLKEKLTFDAIYTGYLGSFRQIDIVSHFFEQHRTGNNLIITDPAMGDYGKLYAGFDEPFALKMGELCGKADIILPNLTEAAFMLGEEYVGEGYDETYIKELLKRLTGLGAKKAVLTGVSFDEAKLGVMSYDSETGEYFTYFREKLDAHYHGTGDIFASCFTGAIVNGLSMEDSLRLAVDYTVECIAVTLKDPDRPWYGVDFETAIPMLTDRLRNK